jgi:membrane protein DedA with SNARE-associated domain
MLDSLILFFTDYGYVAVFGMLLLCGFGLPVPEDITLVAGGVMSGLACADSDGPMAALLSCHQVHLMLAVSMAGVLIGDLTMFTLGRVLGMRITENRWFRRVLSEKRFAKVQEKMKKHGKWILFAARFMPGLRSPIFVVSGITRSVSYARFILTDGTAALISVPVWIYLGFFGSQNREVLLQLIKKGQIGTISVVVGIVLLFVIRAVYKHRKSPEV